MPGLSPSAAMTKSIGASKTTPTMPATLRPSLPTLPKMSPLGGFVFTASS